tara:strand:- start:7055 stop:7168 length:114 start_codon:yes stop_codon:yes gene_type:complete
MLQHGLLGDLGKKPKGARRSEKSLNGGFSAAGFGLLK